MVAKTSTTETAAPREEQEEPRRPGRPRSEQADHAIIKAALDLFAECGPAALCIEQVAARAGVGKATIYRRWPGKEDMLLDALPALSVVLPVPQGKSVRADLIALVDAVCKEAGDPRRARLVALLQGEGRNYPRLKAAYLDTVVRPRRDAIRSVLRRGVATGELPGEHRHRCGYVSPERCRGGEYVRYARRRGRQPLRQARGRGTAPRPGRTLNRLRTAAG